MDREKRELMASWLWFITHSSERDINKLIRKHKWLLNIPITYDCHCNDQGCCNRTEYFKMENENDLAALHQNVISGSCTSNDLQDTENKVILNISVLQGSEKLWTTISCNASTVGIYSAHVFVAKNLKSCFQTAEKLYDFTVNNVTFQKGLHIFDLLIEHKRYEILEAAVCTEGWVFGLGKVYRDKFHMYTASNIQKSLELVMRHNDAHVCKIMLPAIQSRTWTTFVKTIAQNIVEYNAFECLQVLIPYLQKHFVAGKKDSDFIRQYLYQKETLKTLVENGILPLPICFRLAVEEDDVDFVIWMVDRFSLEEEEGYTSLLLQATMNDSPEMIEVLLQASSINRSNRSSLLCYHTGRSTDDHVLAYHVAQALRMKKCADVLFDFDSSLVIDLKKQESIASVVFAVKSKKYPRVELVKRLTEAGCDVNTCIDDQGNKYSPLYDAVVKSDLELIQALLSSGASLFNEKDVSKLGCPPRLLAEYIYRNADICTEHGSVVNDILEGGKKREKLLYLVLQCAHTIPQTDRENLRKLCVDENFYGYTKVTEFLTSPRRLCVLSRNSIRKHYAHKIHEFLSNTPLPPRVRDFLSLKHQLDHYLALPLIFTKAYDSLADLANFDLDFEDRI